jgi:hypothetical protein
MKTTKIFSVLSLVLIFIGMTAVNTSAKANPGGTPRPFIDDKKIITYVVEIAHDASFDSELNGYMVVMTDGKGRSLAPAQPFIPGTWTYIFQENAPATGTRTAMFIKAPHTSGPNIHFRSATIKGPFQGGLKYSLYIVPDIFSDGNVTGIEK